MTRLYSGDFSSGDFNQWRRVINQYGGFDGVDYPENASYSAKIVPLDNQCGYAARFEVRENDRALAVGDSASVERSEVMGYGNESAGGWAKLGTTRWYAFSVKFDSSFPSNQHEISWANVVQWKPYNLTSDYDAPVISWGWSLPGTSGMRNGYWYLIQQHAVARTGQSANRMDPISILELPLNLGQWHDIKMQIKIKTDATGFIKVWWNGQRQTFSLSGQALYGQALTDNNQTFNGQTAPPPQIGVSEDDHGVAVHLGLYRGEMSQTGIVYHSNYRMSDSESSL